MKINIAIDGPSSAGKSTISKMVANRLGYIYLDTGAMYRSVALKTKQLGIDPNDENSIVEMLKDNTVIEFDANENVYLDKVDVTEEIRKNDISSLTSIISAFKKVRDELVARQQLIAKNQPGIVMDGRDIGSVVLKDNAELKIFLTADPVVRAKRRYEELKEMGQELEYEVVLKNIQQRDFNDVNRKNSPLIKVQDAIEIDTTNKKIEDVVEDILVLAKERVASQ